MKKFTINRYKNKLNIFKFPEFKNKTADKIIYWQTHYSLRKLAKDNYDNEAYWWVIAMYNNIDNEKNIKYNQKLYIPSLGKVLKEL